MKLEIKDLKKKYLIPRSFQRPQELFALRGITLSVQQGETLAVVGESGCGKSTLAKVLMKLEPFDEGQIQIDGKPLEEISSRHLPLNLQMVFQDPSSSLNPRKRVFDLIAEPLVIQNQLGPEAIEQRVREVSKSVGVNPEFLTRYPHMMSGGQRQRVGIARALVTSPRLIICDEPVSALDVSVQAQVLNLLVDLREQMNLSYIFISHDLSVIRFIAHRVAVLYLGQVVELADKKDLFRKPLHPYTQLLLGSTPQVLDARIADDNKEMLAIELPSPLNPPLGCAFAGRCPHANQICAEKDPILQNISEASGEKRQVACHHVERWL
jgi:dipeptide transport system ATP-binding protein